ncbi:uncharacterized protein LOC142501777 [Ascaphus truei]
MSFGQLPSNRIRGAHAGTNVARGVTSHKHVHVFSTSVNEGAGVSGAMFNVRNNDTVTQSATMSAGVTCVPSMAAPDVNGVASISAGVTDGVFTENVCDTVSVRGVGCLGVSVRGAMRGRVRGRARGTVGGIVRGSVSVRSEERGGLRRGLRGGVRGGERRGVRVRVRGRQCSSVSTMHFPHDKTNASVSESGSETISATMNVHTLLPTVTMSAVHEQVCAGADVTSDNVEADIHMGNIGFQEEYMPENNIYDAVSPLVQHAKKRNVKFSDEENQVLVASILEHYDRLFGHLVVKTSPMVKRQLWRNIRDAVSGCGIQVRTHDNCRKRFDDIKRKLKIKLQQYSKHARGTGGGPPATPLNLTPLEEQLSAKLPSIVIKGFEGDFDIGVYQDDFQHELNYADEESTEATDSMETQLNVTQQSDANVEDIEMEGSLMDTNIVHDDCPADSEEGTATNEERIDCENDQHHQLMSIQDAEERLIKNCSDNHNQIMCVQEKMLAEITEVKDILRCTVSELQKHNTHMEAIITCLMKHNELQSSNVIPTFLPSTYVATLEAAEFLPNSSDQLFDSIPTIVTQLPGSCAEHIGNEHATSAPINVRTDTLSTTIS